MSWTHTTPINLLLALEDEHLPQIYLTLQEGRRARLSFLHCQSPSALQGIQLLSLNKFSDLIWQEGGEKKSTLPGDQFLDLICPE